MIGTDTFNKSFDRLCASFNKSVTSANRDLWHKEVRECEYKPFVRAMGMLTYGQYWPKFGDFHTAYGTFLSMGAVEKEYCGRCLNGWVIVTTDVGNGEAVALCANCYPKSSIAIDPAGYGLKWVQDPVKFNQNNRQVPPEEAKEIIKEIKGMLEQLANKMATKTVEGPHKRMEDQIRARLKNKVGFSPCPLRLPQSGHAPLRVL